MTEAEKTRTVVAVIRTLGFIGNAHYCAYCLNHFHDDCGQHKPDCKGLQIMLADDEWWSELEDRLS